MAAVERPTPADRKRFPAAVVNIKLPSDEVDFNREMDKTKVFILHKVTNESVHFKCSKTQ